MKSLVLLKTAKLFSVFGISPRIYDRVYVQPIFGHFELRGQVRLGVNVLTSALFASFVAEFKLCGILLFQFRCTFILNDLLSTM